MTTDPSHTVWDDEEAAREAALLQAGLVDGDADSTQPSEDSEQHCGLGTFVLRDAPASHVVACDHRPRHKDWGHVLSCPRLPCNHTHTPDQE